MSDSAAQVKTIWTGDLFDRASEATQVIAYLESVASNPFAREDKSAFTLAIDAPYGVGKSFFIKRLAKTLALNHPVALIDAWSDDLADEPLVALVSTLKGALEPIANDATSKQKLAEFVRKTGEVSKIAAKGLARRGLGLLITAPAVEAIGGVLEGTAEDVGDAVQDALKEAGQGLSQEVFDALGKSPTMQKRISDFEEGKAATKAMKESLKALISSLGKDASLQPPVIVVIDEIDRCRPTYAIKLLEEIKHLFDVPGLVFVLAMNGEQLSHSVAGAYGANFDGGAYLRRFIDRRYRLAEPKLAPLLKVLCQEAGISADRFFFFSVSHESRGQLRLGLHDILAVYMEGYGLTARDAFEFVDILRTCQALTPDQLIGHYLVPLVIGQMKGLEPGDLPDSWKLPEYYVRLTSKINGGNHQLHSLALKFEEKTRISDFDLDAQFERGDDVIAKCVVNIAGGNGGQNPPMSALSQYPKLVSAVSRFSGGARPVPASEA